MQSITGVEGKLSVSTSFCSVFIKHNWFLLCCHWRVSTPQAHTAFPPQSEKPLPQIAQGFPDRVPVCWHYVFGRCLKWTTSSIYTAINAGPLPWDKITTSPLKKQKKEDKKQNTWAWLRMHSLLTKQYGGCFNMVQAQKVSWPGYSAFFFFFSFFFSVDMH